MGKLRVFESFSGIGSMSMALRNLGIDFELVGTSEVDRYAILAYDAIHGNNEDIVIPSKEEMLQEFADKNIAYNFSSGKSEIPRGIKDITKLYKAHIRSKNFGDIQKINPEDLPEMDLYTYSFPCKNISVAGQMAGLEKGSGTQSSLVWESLRIIEYHKPKYLLMENVKNLVSDKFMPYFKMICEELEKLGYNNYWSVLNGKDFDVPQNRERVMMLSIRKDVDKGVFGMPIGVPTTKRLKDVLDDEVEDRYYIPKPIMDKFIPNDNFKTLYNNDGQSPTQVGFIQKGEDGVQHQSNTVYDGNCVSCTLCAGDWKSPKMFMVEGKPVRLGGCFDEPNGSTHQAGSVWEKEGLSPTIDTMQGGYRQPLVFVDKNIKPSVKQNIERELDQIINAEEGKIYACECENSWQDNRVGIEISPTIRARNSHHCVYSDYKIRKLTPKECWRLMGFTDEDFFKAKDLGGLSNTKLYERAGRGIVVPMLEEIFRNMMKNEEE